MDQFTGSGLQVWALPAAFVLLVILFYSLHRNLRNRLRIMESGMKAILPAVNDNLRSIRETLAAERAADREEMGNNLRAMSESVVPVISELSKIQQQQMDSFGGLIRAMSRANEERMDRVHHDVEEQMDRIRHNVEKDLWEYGTKMERIVSIFDAKQDRDERRFDEYQEIIGEGITSVQKLNEQMVVQMYNKIEETLNTTLDTRLIDGIVRMQKTQEQKFEQLHTMVYETVNEMFDARLVEGIARIQKTHEQRLDQLQTMADETLNAALDFRFRDFIQPVSNKLDKIYGVLAKMQVFDADDRMRAPENANTYDNADGVRLDTLLEVYSASGRLARNIAIVPGGSDYMEYAVYLPGKNERETDVYLPIDANFPVEVYHGLLTAIASGDQQEIDAANQVLDETVQNEANRLQIFIQPPYTTDFVMMYLPVDGLFDTLRLNGAVERLWQEARVAIAGPAKLPSVLSGYIEKWGQRRTEQGGKRYRRRMRWCG